MFIIGDKIKCNPVLNSKMNESIWWNKHKNDIMTIKSINNKSITVKENCFGWHFNWMIKVFSIDFKFDIKDFEI